MNTQRYETVLREANEERCKAYAAEETDQQLAGVHHVLADLKMHELELLDRAARADERARPAVEAAARVRDVVESSVRLELALHWETL